MIRQRAMHSPNESIMPYRVMISSDGCTRGAVKLPFAMGSREDCQQFIADHLPPVGYEFEIMCIETGRFVSFMIPPSTLKRRIRVQKTQIAWE